MQQEEFIRRLQEILVASAREAERAIGQAGPVSLFRSVQKKIALSKIELASAFLPVLAVEEGIDFSADLAVGVGTRIFTRADLAELLGLDKNRPFGAQLEEKGILTAAEARLIDGGLFRGNRVHLKMRLDNAVEDANSVLKLLETKNLIDSIGRSTKGSGYLFVEVVTNRFVELSQILTSGFPDLAVILSLDGCVMYLRNGQRFH